MQGLARFKGSRRRAYLRELAKGLDWNSADTLMRALRAELRDEPAWRLGGKRIQSTFARYLNFALRRLGRPPTRFLDFGAGTYQPLAFSTLFWLHGAKRCVALDPDPALVSDQADFISARTAQSLWDIICEIMSDPHDYGFKTRDWAVKLDELDPAALQRGELGAGLNASPLLRFCGSLGELPSAEANFDLVVSQAVMQHVSDFAGVADDLYRRTAPGGVHLHNVGFRDHCGLMAGECSRRPDFLTEDVEDGIGNLLGASEMTAEFERAGFQVLDRRIQTEPIEDGIRERLAPRFRALSDTDLSTTNAIFVLGKDAPDQASPARSRRRPPYPEIRFSQLEEKKDCPVCGGKLSVNRQSNYPTNTDRFRAATIEYCADCGSGSVPGADDLLGDYYLAEYGSQGAYGRDVDPELFFAAEPDKATSRFFTRARRQVEILQTQGARFERVLDFGAGNGAFLFTSRATATFAIEPDVASRKYLAYIGATRIEPDQIVPGSFDIVVSSHVFEHFTTTTLHENLHTVVRSLKPGAFFLLEVPHGGLSYLKKPNYQHPHTLFFTPQGLASLIRSAGLEIVHTGFDGANDIPLRENRIFQPPTDDFLGTRKAGIVIVSQKRAT